MSRPLGSASVRPFAIFLTLFGAASTPCFAQVAFNFAPPGARSLAMGGTFVGLADDATAAEANPAGLTVLTRPELSLHVRSSRFNALAPTIVGLPVSHASVVGPSFASVVYPTRFLTASAYYQVSANYRERSQIDLPIPSTRTLRATRDVDLKAEHVGISLARRISSHLSVGATVRRTSIHLDMADDWIEEDTFTGGPPDRFTNDADDTVSAVTIGAGVLAHVGKVSVGGTYKMGALREASSSVGTCTTAAAPPDCVRHASTEGVHLPDVYSGGVAYRPTERITVAADIAHIRYERVGLDVISQPWYLPYEGTENANEVHLGLEYAIPMAGGRVLALRAGGFMDPDHDGVSAIDTRQRHFTFGAGLVVGSRLQIDAGVNLAKTVREGVVSTVVRF